MQRDQHAAPRRLLFEFVPDAQSYAPPDARVVRIGRRVKSKQALLALYAQGLNLPDYFGWNWDALDECVRDLSWLQPPLPVAIVHEAIPLRRGSADRFVYLDLLVQWAGTPQNSSSPQIRVIFPANAQEKISAQIASLPLPLA